MKKRITLAFFLIFALFAAGTGVTLFTLARTTAGLRDLIGLHEIEDIRQDLFSSIQEASAYIYASDAIIAGHRDEISSSSGRMHEAIRRCGDCHHEPGVRAELAETSRKVDSFEYQLSLLLAMSADPAQRHRQQEEASQASSAILDRVQEMVKRAAATIDRKTELAMDRMERVYLLIAVTLAATFVLALIVAHFLARGVTDPIDALVDSTRKIAAGQWGHQNTFAGTGEFRELIDAFNRMSRVLAEQREQEQQHLSELRRTQQQLLEAEKLSSLGTLAGGIAHDFNNILCGMIGHLNVLARQFPANAESRQTIETIEKAGFRAADLVKQLLTFARQKPMQIQAVALDQILEAVLQPLRETLGADIRVDLQHGTDLPRVAGDPGQLEQVAHNLCLNARDAMPEGGTLFIATRAVRLDEQFVREFPPAKAGDYVLLTVRDTGLGINEKILPRIFDPFFTTKPMGKGTGLGLAMVYGIVKNHDGFCRIESSPGQGTTFRVYLPVAGRQGSQEPQPPAEPVSLAGRTILIVDDEKMVTTMLADYLQDLGCITLVASNGREAVEIYRQRSGEIELVILDILMPVMDGRQTFMELIKIRPDVRVLVSSGYIMNSETQEILNLGAEGFLQKPYNLEAARRTMGEILARS